MIGFIYNQFIILAGVITIACTSLYLYLKKKYKYWEEQGIVGPKPEMFFGNMRDSLSLKITEAELAERWYNEYYDQKYIGVYNLWKPALFVKDVNVLKRILVNDFEYFTDHPHLKGNTHSDSIFDSLLAMKGSIWRERRQFLSRLFTPKKMKDYIQDMDTSLNILLSEIEKKMFEDCDLAKLIERHMMRSICATLYGLDVSNDEDRISKLSYYSHFFSFPSKMTAVKVLIYTVSPKLFEFLKISIYPTCIWNYFSKFTYELIAARCQNKVQKNDLLELVIKMKDDGVLETGKITFEEAVGHIYVFFLGSHHTVELTICHILLQLSLHPEIQGELRQEIDDVLKNSTDITYDHLNRMTYMDCVISETLRMYPLVGVLKRVCTKPYKMNDNLIIPEGTDILIPARSIQMDPQYYPEPDKFMPERFLNSDKTPFTLMPYGQGPRYCIGVRLGEITMKLVLAKVLLNYVIFPSEKMKFPMKFNPRTILVTSRPFGGIWVKIKKKEKSSK